MRFFYDTEFLEDGSTIDLISIGIVAEDGREFYAVNSDMPVDRIKKDDWLCRNVVPLLPTVDGVSKSSFANGGWVWSLDQRNSVVKPKWVIANEVRDFLLHGSLKKLDVDGVTVDPPELWADYAAYDHVVLAQLWGRMIHLPTGIPMFTNDFQQEWARYGRPTLPKQDGGVHNALEDARHLRRQMLALSRHTRKDAA